MDRFPKMLYRFPGTGGDAVALQDGTYSLLQVDDEEAHDAALAEGWSESAADARAAGTPPIAAALEPQSPTTSADDIAPPTRAELEAKATELSISFRSNTSDKALSDRIAAALEP